MAKKATHSTNAPLVEKYEHGWVFRLRYVDFPVRGVYRTHDGMLPRRMRLIHPSAYDDLKHLQEATKYQLVYSDMFRTFKASMLARKRKPGLVAFPGYSGHNFGISIDLAIEPCLEALSEMHDLVPPEPALSDLRWVLRRYNWTPIRSEPWHFNHSEGLSHALPWINETYGAHFNLTTWEIEAALFELGYNTYPIDGILDGKDTQEIRRFQRESGLQPDGIAGRKTQRLLSCLCAEIEVVEE